MDIENMVALITGAASGMGAACAQALAKKGARLVLLDQNLEGLSQNLNAITFACDVSNEEKLNQIARELEEKELLPRIIVHCAGIAPAKKIMGKQGVMSLNDFSQVININLIGTFNILRMGAMLMHKQPALNKDNERGVIINTASIAAFEGQVGQVAYSASKGGVVAMTLPAAKELAAFGIRVNCIAPGLVETPLFLNLPESIQTTLKASVPFPKRLAKPEEFAQLVEHIITNPMINAEVIRLDGGLRMV